MITVINGFQIAPDFQSARKGDKVVNFTYNEATALSVLIAYHQDDTSHNYVPKDVLESSIWDSSEVTANSLRKLMSEIRRKLEGSKDVVIVQSIRNKGYILNFQQAESIKKSRRYWSILSQPRNRVILALVVLSLIFAFYGLGLGLNSQKDELHPNSVIYQSIYATDAAVFNMDYFENVLYLATRRTSAQGKMFSEIIAVKDGVSKTMLSVEDKRFNYIKASPGGQIAYMTHSRDDCDIYITDSSFENTIDHIDCLGENVVVPLDWENERFLYMSLKMEEGKSSRPYKYDLLTKELIALTDYHIDYDVVNGYGSFALKFHNNDIYSLNMDKNALVTLSVITKAGKRLLYEFTNDPLNFDIDGGKVLLVDEKNQFVTLTIPENPIEDEWQKIVVSGQQSAVINTPVISDEFITFVTGEGGRHIVISSDSTRRYTSDFDVINFFQNGNETAVLGRVPNGYKVELYRDEKVVHSSYHDNAIMLRHIGVLNGVLYVGGNDGVFKVGDGNITPLADYKVNGIVAGQNCLYISSPQGVKRLVENEFSHVASQGARVFAFENQCMYEDRVTHNLITPQGIFGNTRNKEYIFFYNGELAYRAPREGNGHLILSMKDDRELGEFSGPISKSRYQSVGSEVLFLTPAKSFSRVQRISKSSIL